MSGKERAKKHYDKNRNNEEFISKRRIANKKWRKNNPEKVNENIRRWREKNPEKMKEINKRSYEKNHKNKERIESVKKVNRKQVLRIKLLVLSKYSIYDDPKCECCLEDNLEFLIIDHINGGGNKHRRELNMKSGTKFYRWLIKNDFPDGYRVLCSNCNSSIGMFIYCPHKDKDKHEEYINLLKLSNIN